MRGSFGDFTPKTDLPDSVNRLILQIMKLEELTAEAAKLPEYDRASLAARLLHGLETPHYSVPDEEVMRRMREADENPDVMITFDQLVSGLRFRAS